MFIKMLLLAPIWTKFGVPYIVFCEESDYDTPGAQFRAKTAKNEQTNFESKNQIEKNGQIKLNYSCGQYAIKEKPEDYEGDEK